MSLIRGLHHIQFSSQNFQLIFNIFNNGFGFKPFCNFRDSFVLRKGSALILINEFKKQSNAQVNVFAQNLSNFTTTKGFVNIVFEVNDVFDLCHRVENVSGLNHIVLEPTEIVDSYGKVKIAVFRSCVFDLLHTVVDISDYSGLFLPGFVPLENEIKNDCVGQDIQQSKLNSTFSLPYFDHITIVGKCGCLDSYTDWYSKVFNMTQMPLNVKGNNCELLIEYHNTGMKLKALDNNCYLKFPNHNEFCKIVIAEPTKNSEPNQLTKFLDANDGPGLQHVALAVDNIVKAVNECSAAGIEFVKSPMGYYDNLVYENPIFKTLPNFEVLKSAGILCDRHFVSLDGSEQFNVLFQIFTTPLLEENGFFMEFIQRNNVFGFGENNVLALWKATEQLENKSKM